MEFYGAPGATSPPERLSGLTRFGSLTADGTKARANLEEGSKTRFLVVWLTAVPEVSAGKFQGEVREIVVRGKA